MARAELTVGLTVNHWRVIEAPKLAYKKGYYTVRCVSRCGVELPVRVADLLQGRPFTCEGCRPGVKAPPPSHRVSPQQDWSVIMAVELINPRCLERDTFRNEEWPKAKRMLELTLNGTQFGTAFGWKIYIKAGHKHKRAKKNGIQVIEANPNQRQVRLRLRVQDSPVHWDINLGWVRQDMDPKRVIDVLKATADGFGKPEPDDDGPALESFVEPDEAEVFGAGLPSPSQAVAFIPNLDDRLGRVKSGLDRIMELNRDVGALQDLKAGAVQAERLAATALVGPRDEFNRLTARQKEVTEECQALAQQVTDLRAKLTKTEQALEKARDTYESVTTDLSAATVTYHPLQAAHEEALANLRRVEADEKERVSMMQKVPDLAALLAAFEKMGG